MGQRLVTYNLLGSASPSLSQLTSACCAHVKSLSRSRSCAGTWCHPFPSAPWDAACVSEDVSVDSNCCFSGTGTVCCSCTSADICCVLPPCRQDKNTFYPCLFLLPVVLCDLPRAGGPVHSRPYTVCVFAESWWWNTHWLSCQLLSVVPSLRCLQLDSCIFANAETFTQMWKRESYFSQLPSVLLSI